MSKGSRRLMGIENPVKNNSYNKNNLYKKQPIQMLESNHSAISNKITTSDDDDEEYVLVYDSKYAILIRLIFICITQFKHYYYLI